MIVGCYTVHLYCDHPDAAKYVCTRWPLDLSGKNERECLRDARRQGWVVRGPGDVRCPKHKA